MATTPIITTVSLGNESVIEGYKPDEGVDTTLFRPRKDLGSRVVSMNLSETEGRMVEVLEGKPPVWVEQPSRSMNLTMAIRLWTHCSDKDPSWVESNDPLFASLLADHFGGIPTKRPKDWKEG